MPAGGGKGKGGGGSSKVDVTSTSDSTVDIVGLDDINVTAELKLPQPLRTETTTELKIPQPLRTETTNRNELTVTKPIETRTSGEMSLDIKPVVLDLCFTLKAGPLPETRISRPYRHHFGVSLFGTEVLGLDFAGETRTVIEDLPGRPAVARGGRPAPSRAGGHEDDGGLRIRLGS